MTNVLKLWATVFQRRVLDSTIICHVTQYVGLSHFEEDRVDGYRVEGGVTLFMREESSVEHTDASVVSILEKRDKDN